MCPAASSLQQWPLLCVGSCPAVASNSADQHPPTPVLTVCPAESGMASACLSSPHLRTNSAQEPPRSVVLLGKRVQEEEAGEPTPASKLRSVRQKSTEGPEGTDLPFLLPQPLFAAGGGSGGRQAGHYGMHDEGGGRSGGRGKASKKKPAKEVPTRNRRKPPRPTVTRHHQVRLAVGCLGCTPCQLAASLPGCQQDSARHRTGSDLRYCAGANSTQSNSRSSCAHAVCCAVSPYVCRVR